MVRIIQHQQTISGETDSPLDHTALTLLKLLGIIIAEHSEKIIRLLENFGLKIEKPVSDQDLTDNLLFAIGEANPEFNAELAEIILDCSLDSNSDGFNIKGLLNQGSGSSEADSAGANGGGGMLGAIGGAIQGISGAVGKGLQNRQAKNQATAQTLQSVIAYKQQLASNRQTQPASFKRSSSSKLILLITLFTLTGLAIAAMMYYKRTHKPFIQPTA